MEAPHERAAGYLTMTWTPTDQVIMEHLLLEEEQHAPSPPLSSSSSPSSPELWKSSDAAANSADNDSCSAGSGSESTSKVTTAAAKKGDEERRARHRAVQRRFVQRKKEAFRRTKQFAQELEAKYRFLRIAAEERDLRHERVMLEAQSVSIAPPNTDAIAVSNPVDELIEKQLELVREFFVPLSMEELSAVQRSNQYEYDISLSTGRDEMYQTTGLTIMGWNDHRKIDDASVKLALSKEFPNVRALDLMDRTWRCLSSPETYGSFFSPILNIKMQLLQVIDRDTVVIHRVLYHPQTQRTSNSLELLWRVRLGGEYVIFDASLQNNAAQKCLGESYNWTQMTTSMSFVPTPSDGCLFRHGGWLRRFAISTLKYWLIEMFFMALRFESSMVAPVFALPPDTGSASASPEPASDVQSDDAQSDDAASPSLLAA